MNIRFLFNRLRLMNAAEIIFRLLGKLRALTGELAAVRGKKADISIISGEGRLFCTEIRLADRNELLVRADKLCDSRMDIFALKDFRIPGDINYHMDYSSGCSAPADVPAWRIDYRDSASIGDIKYIWEINRHLFLTVLALAFHISDDNRYLIKFEYYLLQWFRQNCFMRGVNWSSPLELGIRLINWAFCWHLLGGTAGAKFSDQLRKQWVESIYWHCRCISENFSRYSSANNHLIGEAAGLFIASTVFPQFKESSFWRSKSFDILKAEALKQNFEDGVNKEQAVAYQGFVLEFLILAGLAGKANNIEFPRVYWERTEKMLEYLAALGDAGGNIPQFGDDDDGAVLELGQGKGRAFRSLLNAGAVLFGRRDFFKITAFPDIKTELLLSIYASKILLSEAVKAGIPSRFYEGGCYILGSHFNSPMEQKLVFDSGSLGYLSIAAHGHSDALSVCFSAGGCPILADPGTYAYHTHTEWRNYFRSTFAHNTVCIDNLNQSEMLGNFMWGRKANAHLISYEGCTFAEACHDGYMRLKDKVKHIRRVRFIDRLNQWEITDSFECLGRHRITVNFHLHPSCSIELLQNVAVITFEKGTCTLMLDTDFEAAVLKGSENPCAGWYSEAYDIKIPTPTLTASKNIVGTTHVTTRMKVAFKEVQIHE